MNIQNTEWGFAEIAKQTKFRKKEEFPLELRERVSRRLFISQPTLRSTERWHSMLNSRNTLRLNCLGRALSARLF